MATARIAGAGERVAGLLRYRTSADSLRVNSGEILAGDHGLAATNAEPGPHPDRRAHCCRAEWDLEEEWQALCAGHAGGPRGVGSSALHERELRQISRPADTQQSDPGHRRGQYG